MEEINANLPKVSMIILNWNNRAILAECLESVERSDYPNLVVYVADNGSTDDAVAYTRKHHPNVQVVENKANLGYAAGNNRAIEVALKQGTDYILLLNNDVTIAPDMVRRLVDGLEARPAAGMAGPKIYYDQPPDLIWYAGGEVLLDKGIIRHTGIREKDIGQYDTAREVDYITGCALLVKRETLDRIGYLDETYLAYAEDCDWCLRAKKAGYELWYIPEGNVWHKISASSGRLSFYKLFNKARGMWIFFKRHSPKKYWPKIAFFQVIEFLRILKLIANRKI